MDITCLVTSNSYLERKFLPNVGDEKKNQQNECYKFDHNKFLLGSQVYLRHNLCRSSILMVSHGMVCFGPKWSANICEVL